MNEMKLKETYFNKIRNKEKIYEIRLNDEKRQLIKIGDLIVFKKEPELQETLTAEVVGLEYFKSFKEMAETLPLDKVGFGKETLCEVVSIYHQFYTEQEEDKYGVVAIKIEVR